eukprot:5852037-Prymnesium_polylepis.1
MALRQQSGLAAQRPGGEQRLSTPSIASATHEFKHRSSDSAAVEPDSQGLNRCSIRLFMIIMDVLAPTIGSKPTTGALLNRMTASC